MTRGTAGLDYRLAPGTVVGFARAGGGTNWSLAQGIGGGKSDAFQAGVYGTARSGPAYLAAALAYTNHWMSTDRFAFAGDHLTASFNAQSFGGRLESGYRFATYYGGLTPYAAIQSQTFHTPGYTETDLNGGGFALGFNSRNATRKPFTKFDHVNTGINVRSVFASLSSADEGIVLRSLGASEARRLRPDLLRTRSFQLAGSRVEWQPGRSAQTVGSMRSP
jgi:uncharacterized protein with beta-barrel porin domain